MYTKKKLSKMELLGQRRLLVIKSEDEESFSGESDKNESEEEEDDDDKSEKNEFEEEYKLIDAVKNNMSIGENTLTNDSHNNSSIISLCTTKSEHDDRSDKEVIHEDGDEGEDELDEGEDELEEEETEDELEEEEEAEDELEEEEEETEDELEEENTNFNGKTLINGSLNTSLNSTIVEFDHSDMNIVFDKSHNLFHNDTQNKNETTMNETDYNLNDQQNQLVEWMVSREYKKQCGGIIATDLGTADDKIAIIMDLLFKSKVCNLDNSQSAGEIDLDETNFQEGHTLILCTKSTIHHWIDCVNNKIPSGLLNVVVHYGKKRDTSLQNLTQKDIVITTVTLVLTGFRHKESNVLYQIKWNRIILDDPQCKRYNYKLKTSKALCKLSGIVHWIFAGPTFVDKDNDEEALYGLIKFINYTPLKNFEDWKKWLKANKNISAYEKLRHLCYSEKIV